MITYLSKLLSNLVLTPVSSSDPPGSDLQHGSSTTGLVDPPQGEWIPVSHKGQSPQRWEFQRSLVLG